MRTLPLNVSDEKGDFVESVTSASLATISPLTQGDTVQIAVTKVVRPDKPSATLAAWVVKPWAFTQIRFSLGYLDKAPQSGTFKLKIAGTLTTGVITWPTDPTVAQQVTDFKAAIVTAINAVAGTSAVRSSDRTGAPANLIYLTWTSPTDTRTIEIVESALVPAIDTSRAITNTNGTPAFEQLLTLSRLPLVETSTFAFPSNGVPGIAEEVLGATGKNEVQIITINSSILGACDLVWSGAHTAPLNIQGLTAAQIQTALNAIVANGDTNPSFSVSARAAQPGVVKFAVSFIGPLAGAAQALLTATALQQETQLTAYGKLELLRSRFAAALNGQPSCKVIAELVIVDSGGESTITREVTINDDMTTGGTEAAIAGAGGIMVVERTVYIDESTADPFITAAAGLSYTVPIICVGTSIVSVPHSSFSSQIVGVRVHKQIGLDVSENWVECKDTEYGNSSADPTATVVTFPFNFVNDTSSPYHYAYWKILLTDPDATVALLNDFKLPWDNCLASLPSGQTLTAKLAAIDAALGVFGGTLRVAAANINGTLTAAQIDAAGLAPSIVNQASFSAALQSLYATSPTLVTNLLTQLGASTSFATTLVNAITNGTTITDAISASLVTNASFGAALQTRVLDIIQGAGNLPAGAAIYFIEPMEISMPAPQEQFAPAIITTVPATEATTTSAGGSSTVLTKTTEATVITPAFAPVYAALSPQLTGLTSGGTKSGKLPATDAGSHYYTVSGSAKSGNARGLRGQTFADGDVIAFGAGHWYRVVNISSVWYPADFETPLVKPLIVDATELYAGSRFSLSVPAFFQLLGNVTGRCHIIAQLGDEASSDAEPGSWTTIFDTAVHLSATARLRSFGLTVTRATGGALSGQYLVQGQAVNFTPATASFAVRMLVSQLTLGASSDPRGSLSIRVAKGAALASIVAL